MLFLSSTPCSQNLKFIKKCPSLMSLKTKFQLTQKFFLTPHQKVLKLKFLGYVMVQVHTIYPGLLLESPIPCNFKNEILGSVPSIYTEVLAQSYIACTMHQFKKTFVVDIGDFLAYERCCNMQRTSLQFWSFYFKVPLKYFLCFLIISQLKKFIFIALFQGLHTQRIPR